MSSISSISFDSAFLSVHSQDTIPTDLLFSPDKSKCFVSGDTNARIYQYTVGDPNDLQTWSYDGLFLSVSGQDADPMAIIFSPDATKIFVAGNETDKVYQYTVGDPNDLQTWSYDGVSLYVQSIDGTPNSMEFSESNDKFFFLGTNFRRVHQYSVTDPNDLLTWSYDDVFFDVTDEDTFPTSIAFSPHHKKIIISGNQNDLIYQYQTENSSDASSWSFDSVSFSIKSEEPAPGGIEFSEDGSKLFVIGRGSGSGKIHQYSVIWDPPLPESGPTTNEELFQASYADASAADPKVTALNSPTSVQRSIDTGVAFLVGRPMDYFVKAIVPLGKMSELTPANAYFVQADQPGLRAGKTLLLKGIQASSAAAPGKVRLHFVG